MSDDDAGFFRNLGGLATEWVSAKRRALQDDPAPETAVDSTSAGTGYSFSGQEIDFEDLRDIKDMRESGGQVAQLMDYKALLNFGEGAEIHVENNDETEQVIDGTPMTLEEWLELQFPQLDLTVLDLGSDALWYPAAVGELRETQAGDFKEFLPAEPWTVLPVTNDRGEIIAWKQQVLQNGTRQEQTLNADVLSNIVLNKQSARDKTGISEVLRNEDEITAFKENEQAINNAIELHGFPQRHVKVGREEGAPVRDDDLRRVRTLFDPHSTDANTAYFTGQDVDVETLEAEQFDYTAIHEMDMRNLTTALGLPLEAGNVGADGLGSGKPAELRFALLKLAIKANQRSFSTQFVEKVIRPVIRDYSPFDHTARVTVEIDDPLEDIGETADLIQKVGDYMTNAEKRRKLDLPEPEDEETAESYRSPAEIEKSEEGDGAGDMPGGGGGFFRDLRALQTPEGVPDNAVSISDRSEAPEGAQVVQGPGGGLYYVPSAGDGGDGGTNGETINSAEEFEDAIPTPNEGEATLTDEQRQELSETTAAALRGGVDASDVVSSLKGGQGYAVDEIAHSAAREVSAQPVNGFNSEASVLSRGSDFTEEAESVFAERFGEDAAEEMDLAKDGWRTDMFNEETAAIHQLAAELTGNEQLPDGVDNVHDIDTADAPVSNETAEQIREQSIDALREVYGDEVTVYRGLSPGGGPSPAEATDVSNRLLEAKENGDTVEMEHRSAESWSANPQYATRYAFDDDFVDGEYVRNEGAVVETTVPVEDAVMASMGGTLAPQEDEVVLAHEESAEYEPDNIHGFEEMDEGLAAEKLLATAAERANNE